MSTFEEFLKASRKRMMRQFKFYHALRSIKYFRIRMVKIELQNKF